MTKKEQIHNKILELLNDSNLGIRYSELARQLIASLPDISPNTIHGTLCSPLPKDIIKPAKGVFMHIKYMESPPQNDQQIVQQLISIKEEMFYEPFADWLVNELEECTKAIKVGGNIFKDKWGTPDVIGVLEPRKSDIIKFSTEIVSGEIKIDSSGLITAFGQACAYRLFSHKSYIVVPRNSQADDISRLDALSRIYGIGLILCNAANPVDPNFEIRVRAQKIEPDMYYVNRCMKIIEDDLF